MSKEKGHQPADDKPNTSLDGAQPEKFPRVPLPGRWSDVMNDVIEEAIRSGAFDNLPGRGKPLKLVNNPYAPGTELAYQLLKDNEYTLPWISQRRLVLEEIDALRAEVSRSWHLYDSEYRASRSKTVRMALRTRWTTLLERWRARIIELNRLIDDVNLKLPSNHLEIVKLSFNSELAKAGARKELEAAE